jgi:hypothetical protein
MIWSNDISSYVCRPRKKKLPPSAEDKRPLIEAAHPALSVRRQCELLGLSRSSLYYEAVPETQENGCNFRFRQFSWRTDSRGRAIRASVRG